MRIHFIAIGGSAMHNLAIALHKNGHTVTGSDDVFYEPSAGRLARYGLLPDRPGWFPGKITPELDAVILGMHARETNPELMEAQRRGIRIYSYPEYIYEQSKTKTRVVIGGSHGKTTITAMIMHVLKENGVKFDYLVGAMLDGFDTMVQLSDAPVILIEGDEYLASPIDRRPKFHLYRAHLAVLSGIAWDHINVFPTFENYKMQFSLFLDSMEKGGKLAYAPEDPDLADVIAAGNPEIEKVEYAAPRHSIKNGLTWILRENKEPVSLLIFGQHNLTNMGGALQICTWLGVSEDNFFHAISSFKGAARRLELLGKNDNVFIYKDFAHSPSKLRATLNATRQQFPDKKLIACMELHTFSSLNEDFLGQYAGTMDAADETIVFIDEKTFQQKGLLPFSDDKVRQTFGKNDLRFFSKPGDFENYLREIAGREYVLLLMSSGNFGGINLDDITSYLLTKNH